MNKKIKFIAALIAMTCMFMGAAFAKSKNFEEVFAEKRSVSEQYESACEQMKESMGSVFKDIRVYAEGDCLVYEYVYAIDVDVDSAKEMLAAQIDTMKPMFNDIKKEVKKDFGYKKLDVKYVYKTKDDELIYEFKF